MWNVGFPNSLCGAVHNTWLEDIIVVDVEVTHDQPDLEIEITSNLDQDASDESWGIRAFQLFLQDGTLENADDRDAQNKNKW